MHIDLNSCFATIEQQANPLLRGKPIAVAAFTGPAGCILAPSIEAKKLGIKTGMRVREAKELYSRLIVLPPDPQKYRAVHLMFRKIFESYSPVVVPKSIDEAIIDFSSVESMHRKSLDDIGYEIKKRIKMEIGEWIVCSIGIATNRFLAKTAASLHKPDGLDVITHKNLRDVYESLTLIDLCGINTRFQARLNSEGIFTPLEFLDASLDTLKFKVFQSVCGYYWFVRLRGWEIDAVDFDRKTYGQSYALHEFTEDMGELSRILMKLCEKMGRRLRKSGSFATGIHVACQYMEGAYWHKGRKTNQKLYTTQELFFSAYRLLTSQPEVKKLTHLAVNCFDLQPISSSQLDLFESDRKKKWAVTDTCDMLNDRYGEYVVAPARMMNMNDEVIDRIAFGGVKELEDLYPARFT